MFKIYSVLKASIGFTFIALCAGIKPASKPDNTRIIRAMETTPKLTLGFRNISTGPLASNSALTP